MVAVLTQIRYFPCRVGVYLTSFKNQKQNQRKNDHGVLVSPYVLKVHTVVLSNACRILCHDALCILTNLEFCKTAVLVRQLMGEKQVGQTTKNPRNFDLE